MMDADAGEMVITSLRSVKIPYFYCRNKRGLLLMLSSQYENDISPLMLKHLTEGKLSSCQCDVMLEIPIFCCPLVDCGIDNVYSHHAAVILNRVIRFL